MKLFNAPEMFRDEFYQGYLAAYRGRIVGVPEGFGLLRAGWPDRGGVAVLFGGGSGHYPTRAGLVGPGLADIAVVGNTFASPPAQHILRCTQAVDQGSGVLYVYGNYSGDRLNFDMAAEEAQDAGIAVRQVVGNDDVASAPRGEEQKRRGIAGDFFLVKIAGAAATEGRGLDAVAEVTEHANTRIRSFGIAFDGCTLPGQSAPIFTVASGCMEVGLGIHGEPGVGTAPAGTADDVAELLVSRVVDDARFESGTVALLLNSLGRTHDEELFVVNRRVSQLLAARGINVHHSIVGSLTTSLDMEGCSLSLLWLDQDLTPLYDAPASSPAYTHHVVVS